MFDEQDRFIYNTQIDRILTIEKFGYDPIDLKEKSKKQIISICKDCGKIKITTKNLYYPLCKSCAIKKRWSLPKPGVIVEDDKYLNNTQIDRILTINKFGYDPIDLIKGSHRKVIAICKKCGKIRISQIRNYRDLCNSCTRNQKENRINHSCIMQGINRNEFIGFLTNQRYCKLFNEKFKEKIREQYHRKCYLCNKLESDNGRKLDVHHVNYNKKCLCGSACEFIPLCMQCHAKTGRNRQYWEDLIMNYLYPERYFMGDI